FGWPAPPPEHAERSQSHQYESCRLWHHERTGIEEKGALVRVERSWAIRVEAAKTAHPIGIADAKGPGKRPATIGIDHCVEIDGPRMRVSQDRAMAQVRAADVLRCIAAGGAAGIDGDGLAIRGPAIVSAEIAKLGGRD